jgi:hypothetical protein
MVDGMEEESLLASERQAADKAAADAVRIELRTDARPADDKALRSEIEQLRAELAKVPAAPDEKVLRKRIEDELGPAMERELRQALSTELRAQIEKELHPRIEKELHPRIEKELRPQIEKELRGHMEKELRPQLEKELRPQIEKELRAQLEVKRDPDPAKPVPAEPPQPAPAEAASSPAVTPSPVSAPKANKLAEKDAAGTPPVVKTVPRWLLPNAPKGMATPGPAGKESTPRTPVAATQESGPPAPAKPGALRPATAERKAYPSWPTKKPGPSQTTPALVPRTPLPMVAAAKGGPAPAPAAGAPVSTPAPASPEPSAQVAKPDSPPSQPAPAKKDHDTREEPAAGTPGTDVHERAKRRARVIVSDLTLYEKEALMKAAHAVDSTKELGVLWNDAVRSYNQAVPLHVRNSTTYLEEELGRCLAQLRKA